MHGSGAAGRDSGDTWDTHSSDVDEPESVPKRPRVAPDPRLQRLSAEQRAALREIVEDRRNTMLTGSAGTGKTLLLDCVRTELETKLLSRRQTLGVTATTGVAATHLVGGTTIHTFLGFGTEAKSGDIRTAISRAARTRKEVAARIRSLGALIIDEGSMLSAAQLDGIDYGLRDVMGVPAPFGGVQIILTGDLLQIGVINGDPIFKAAAWPPFRKNAIYLQTVYRQSDNAFTGLLARARIGKLTPADVKALNARKMSPPDDTVPRVFTHNAQVDRYNEAMLRELPDRAREFVANDSKTWTPPKSRPPPPPSREDIDAVLAEFEKKCRVDATLELAKGARVIMTANVDVERGLCNGACGTITGFNACGRPIVRFDRGMTEVVVPFEFTSGPPASNLGTYAFRREQIPLRLGWAVSVHRSQGMTLGSVALAIKRSFTPGQAYVGVSRVNAIEGLYLEAAVTVNTFKCDPESRSEDERLLAAYKERVAATQTG